MRNDLYLTKRDIVALKKVALGYLEADIVLQNGCLVDVYTGKFESNISVAIKGEWIAAVGTDLRQTIGKNTQVYDVSGKYILPGFIDSHTHLNYIYSPFEFLSHALVGGTTTIITEDSEFLYTGGLRGVKEFIKSYSNQPIKIFVTIPVPMNLNPSGNIMIPSTKQFYELIKQPKILGVGESYWQNVIYNKDKYLLSLGLEAYRLGKRIEGHAAGSHNEKLNAYLNHAISSCHESTSIGDILERLRLGLFVMIREGSIRQELKALKELTKMDIDYHRIAIVTDGVDPRDLKKFGYLEYSVQKALELGFDFIRVIQMVTINPAIYFRIDHITGGIAPSKHADIIVLKDKNLIKPELVFSQGKLIAHNGNLLVKPKKKIPNLPGIIKIKKHVSPEDLTIKLTSKDVSQKIRAIELITELLTKELILSITKTDKEIGTDLTRDIVKLSLISLNHKITNTLIKGTGLKHGAIASSYVWETYGIVALGINSTDMATAINHIIDIKGGIAISLDGNIICDLPLPLGGIMSPLQLDEIIERLNIIQQKANEFGFKYNDIIKTLSVLTTGAIPFIRITENGLFDFKTCRNKGIFIP